MAVTRGERQEAESHPALAEGLRHERIDADAWDDVYVVGDVHGCLRELRTLVDRIGPSDRDLFVFVGDLVRKGPDSKGVVDFVREHDNMITIRGNNEEKLLRGTKELPELTHDDLTWIRSLPVAISFEDALVVHGGVDPRKPLDDHDVDELLAAGVAAVLTPGASADEVVEAVRAVVDA